MSKPHISLSIGDPAGIGPEIAVKLLLDREVREAAEIFLYGPEDIIRYASSRFAPNLELNLVGTGELPVSQLVPGELSARCGKLAYDAVCAATDDVIAGKSDAIVTCPVNKAAVNLAGIPFTGHTELVAAKCGITDFAMMQSAGPLRVIFVTTHIALKDVSAHISIPRIRKVTELLDAAARADGVKKPKIAIAGLNPHAGENGNMGTEDEKIVKPAVAQLLADGFDVEGPFPSDTLFVESIRNRFDGIVSMYHDQGHIPFKMLAFDRGVNSTLGLPVIRTSVDHGTAFNIAWKGVADCGSLKQALLTAVRRVEHRKSPV